MNVPVSELRPGQAARVVELRTGDAARLDRLGAYGLVPGSLVQMAQAQPTYILRIGETEIAVDHDVAREIIVEAG